MIHSTDQFIREIIISLLPTDSYWFRWAGSGRKKRATEILYCRTFIRRGHSETRLYRLVSVKHVDVTIQKSLAGKTMLLHGATATPLGS